MLCIGELKVSEAGADTLDSMVLPFITRDKVKTPVLLLCRFLQNLIIRRVDAGWSSLAARRAHNPKVVGSNPTPATIFWYFLVRPRMGLYFCLQV